jgi:hypothetical protein
MIALTVKKIRENDLATTTISERLKRRRAIAHSWSKEERQNRALVAVLKLQQLAGRLGELIEVPGVSHSH